MAGRTRAKVPPTAAQRPLIQAAKEAVDALVAKLVAVSDYSTPMVRKKLDAEGDHHFGLAFRDGASARHVASVMKVYPKLSDLFADGAWAAAAKASAAEIVTAAQALNGVLEAFGEAPLPLPVQRESVLPFSAVARSLWIFAREGATSHPLPQPNFEDFDKGLVIESRRGPVQERLEHKNGALCYLRGISAYGKTTTALIIAFAEQRRGFAASYLDFSHDYDYDDASILSSFEVLLARGKKQIVVIDNAHRNPSLVRSLRVRWEAREQDKRPKLLIVGTKVSYPPTMHADYVMDWPDEHTLDLTLEPSNFGDIAKFYVKRARNWAIEPPEVTQRNWSRTFANHLHAFTFAVLARAHHLGRGENWVLSVDHALGWIRENWLRRRGRGETVPIGNEELDNLITLCAFGEDRFELAVPEVALPHIEEHLRHHRSLGVVRQSARLKPPHDPEQVYQLMEHGWGELILQAARIPLEHREAIRTEAMRRSSELAFAVASRLRNDITADLLGLIRSLDRRNWIGTLANGSLVHATNWLTLLRGCDTVRAKRLSDNLEARVKTDSASLAELTFGQLANLCDQVTNAQEIGSDTENSTFLSDLALLDPPFRCMLIESAEQGLNGNQLAFMSRLPADSSLRRKLEGAALKAIPSVINAALNRNLVATTQILDLLNENFAAGFERALDELTEPSRAAALSQQVSAGRLRDFEAAWRLARNGPSTDARVVNLIFRPLAETDWAERTKGHIRPCEGAPSMIKTLVFLGMEDVAAKLAEFIAHRADANDLWYVGHSGRKRIEWVARVCLACPDGELTRSYFAAMVPTIITVLGNPKTRGGLIADSLSALSACEDLNLQEFGLEAAIKGRLRQLPSPADQSAKGRKAVAEYVRQLGGIVSGWPVGLFESEIKSFVDSVGLEMILTNSTLRVPDSAKYMGYLQNYQMQYWQGLFGIHSGLGLDLLAESELARQIHALLQGNRKYQAEKYPKSLRRAAWLTSMSEWLARVT